MGFSAVRPRSSQKTPTSTTAPDRTPSGTTKTDRIRRISGHRPTHNARNHSRVVEAGTPNVRLTRRKIQGRAPNTSPQARNNTHKRLRPECTDANKIQPRPTPIRSASYRRNGQKWVFRRLDPVDLKRRRALRRHRTVHHQGRPKPTEHSRHRHHDRHATPETAPKRSIVGS